MLGVLGFLTRLSAGQGRGPGLGLKSVLMVGFVLKKEVKKGFKRKEMVRVEAVGSGRTSEKTVYWTM
jgi:hypothetical protein